MNSCTLRAPVRPFFAPTSLCHEELQMPSTRDFRAFWIAIAILIGAVVGTAIARPGLVRILSAAVSYKLRPAKAPSNDDTTYTFKGLQDVVRIHFDAYGIPHIDAKTTQDLMFATGLAQGKDRFFQIDILRRFARGRVSELIGNRAFRGNTTVDFDRSMRGWGLEQVAIKSWQKVSAKEKLHIEAFCRGINEALKRFPPPEYKILGTKPQPFTPIDAYSVGLLNAWSISHNWQQELVRLLLAMELGIDQSRQLYPHTSLDKGVSIALKSKAKKLPEAIAPDIEQMFKKPWPKPKKHKHKDGHGKGHDKGHKGHQKGHKKGHKQPHHPRKRASLPRQRLFDWINTAAATIQLVGNSNAWVVNGSRSKSGKPLLANDPHLTHFAPSLFYQQHLKGPDVDVIGVTMPGVPHVLIGQNRHIAWGITSAVADAMDLVIEKLHPTKKDQFLSEGKACPLTRRKVQVKIRTPKGMSARTFTIRESCHGPLLNDMLPHLLPKGSPLVAVQWRLDGVNLKMFAQIAKAETLPALYKAMKGLATPVSAVQAADTKGNIALFWAGQVPKRAHRGTFPYPGWRKAYQWQRMLTHKEIPFGHNPKKGYFAHANNLLVDPKKSQHVLQIDSAPPYRVKRISALIERTPKHTQATFGAIQRDLKVLRAKLVLPSILEDLKGITHKGSTSKAALTLLQKWDLHATSTSPAAAIFFVTYRNAVSAAMKGKLSAKAFTFFMTQRYTTNITDAWFLKKDHIAWDHHKTKPREQRTPAIRKAFLLAVEQLRATQGDNPLYWRWGKLHTIHFKHLLGGVPGLSSFNMPRHMGMGSLETVWKTHFDMGHPKEPFRTVAGPVLRMLVDLSDMNKSRWVIDTGASGWPSSPHHKDQFAKWIKGQTVPMHFDWREIPSQASGTWLLQPSATKKK